MDIEIPQSYWRIEKVYFTATPVVDFLKRYEEWLKGEGETLSNVSAEFAERISKNDFIQLYQFPQKRTDVEHDYFEMTDDNHVIPRHLFTTV